MGVGLKVNLVCEYNSYLAEQFRPQSLAEEVHILFGLTPFPLAYLKYLPPSHPLIPCPTPNKNMSQLSVKVPIFQKPQIIITLCANIIETCQHLERCKK